ncbi:MAG: LPS export ABC transporter periplasmic protein LptC [candidate division WOR-3 bacterium]
MKHLPLLLALISCLLFLGCEERPGPDRTGALPDQVVEEFRLHESHSGTKLYTLEAERALVFENEQRSDVVSPRVFFYDDAGRVAAVLVADSGTIYSRTQDLVAKGHVQVATAESTVLLTESLAYNNQRRIVRTDAPVQVRTPEGSVSGQGLVSDAGLTRLEILSEVRGTSTYRFQP